MLVHQAIHLVVHVHPANAIVALAEETPSFKAGTEHSFKDAQRIRARHQTKTMSRNLVLATAASAQFQDWSVWASTVVLLFSAAPNAPQ